MKNNNLWAPWRIEYLKSLDKSQTKPDGDRCFLCEYRKTPDQDTKNLVLCRGRYNTVVMNRFPYVAGHLLIAPISHVPDLDLLDEQTMLEMMLLARDFQKILAQTIRPHGFNFGINIGRCSGAGLPDHVHTHIVPRWDGDTNFMSVTGHTRVISQSLEELYNQLTRVSKELQLPMIQ